MSESQIQKTTSFGPSADFLEPFSADGTIEALRHPAKNGFKITRSDVRASATRLLELIANHPSSRVADFTRDSPDFEERKRNYRTRSVVRDAFTGGFSGSSEMQMAYNRLSQIAADLHDIASPLHFLASAEGLSGRLLKAFDALEQLDQNFDRKGLVEKFATRLGEEFRIETASRPGTEFTARDFIALLNR